MTDGRDGEWRVSSSSGEEYLEIIEQGRRYRKYKSERIRLIGNVTETTLNAPGDRSERRHRHEPAAVVSRESIQSASLSGNGSQHIQLQNPVRTAPPVSRSRHTSASSSVAQSIPSTLHPQFINPRNNPDSLFPRRTDSLPPSSTASTGRSSIIDLPIRYGPLDTPQPSFAASHASASSSKIVAPKPTQKQSAAQSYTGEQRQKEYRSSLSGLDDFFAQIEEWDYSSCRKFILNRPEILKSQPSKFINEAKSALLAKKKDRARQCVQQALLLKQLKGLSGKQADVYLEKLMKKSRERDIFIDLVDQDFSQILEAIGPGSGEGSFKKAGLATATPTQTQLASNRPPNSSLISLFNTASALDDSYKIQTSSSKYFTLGRVFSVLWHENAGTSRRPDSHISNEGLSTRDNQWGERIISKPRRMVVVKADYKAFCLCIPINTYGGQGLKKKGLTQQEVDAHAIVHMSDTEPSRLVGERPIMKKPIMVVMSLGQKLSVASRLNFAKVYTVEHNVKVKDVGRVADTSRVFLVQHFQETMTTT